MEPAPPPAPEWFVARDRARRFAFRLEQVARERATAWAGDRVGMTSFAEAGPALLSIEDDVRGTIEAVLARRLRDRERGEAEIPLVAALESVLERVARARRLAEWRRSRRAPPEWAEGRFAEVLADAVRRLADFAETYDAKRLVALPAPADAGRLLRRLEADAALDRAGPVVTSPPVPPAEPADRPLPRLVTAAPALDDLLRAARAEVPDAVLPWRVTPSTGASPLVLSLGGDPAARPATPATDAAEAAALPAGDAVPAARTTRAAEVLRFAHGVEVRRTLRDDGTTAALSLALEDATAGAVGAVAPAGGTLPQKADAAVRAWVVAKARAADPLDPTRLVAAKGLLRAVASECERVLAPLLRGAAPRVVAASVPREASRKAPVRREVVAALRAGVEGFPVHRLDEVLDAVAHGKATAAHLRPPDAVVGLALFGRRWPTAGGFGDRVLALGPLTDADVFALLQDLLALHALEQALERGRDPGADWGERLESSAFAALERLARAPG